MNQGSEKVSHQGKITSDPGNQLGKFLLKLTEPGLYRRDPGKNDQTALKGAQFSKNVPQTPFQPIPRHRFSQLPPHNKDHTRGLTSTANPKVPAFDPAHWLVDPSGD